jgi:hypothetical protein
MVKDKNEVIFGSLLNYVQYFADIGGFDAMLALLQMGMSPAAGKDQKGTTP